MAGILDPNIKTVSRADLYASQSSSASTSASSRESSPSTGRENLKSALQAQTSLDIDIVDSEAPQEHSSPLPTEDDINAKPRPSEDDHDTYSFRLFNPFSSASATASAQGATQIRLSSPSEQTSSISQRPASYYLSRKFTASERDIALSGADVLRLSTRPCPGLMYSWRIQHWPASCLSKAVRRSPSHQQSANTERDQEQEKTRRRRKGKKARIKIRRKSAAQQQAVREKEEHVREKKTRLNRIKQLRRREKARSLKAVNTSAITGASVPASTSVAGE